MYYTPDKWELIKIGGTDPYYKVFGTWYGGYLSGDSWRLNSGVSRIEEDDEHYYFHGASGSCYKVIKHARGTSAYTACVLSSMLDAFPYEVTVIGRDIDIMSIEW